MLIALSGGADSVALLIHQLELHQVEAAAHCNFHLRGAESYRDEAFVRQLCRERGVRLHVTQFHTEEEALRSGESIEMAARRLRYEWFAQLCREHHYHGVAVAHHQEDNAETMLLNLLRGTGLRGLCGMQAERDGVVRPLLHWTRQQILDFLESRHQSYVTDSTNADTHYRRNFIRHRVLPLLSEVNPQVVTTLNRTAAQLLQVQRIYEAGLQQLTARFRQPMPGGWRAEVAPLAAQPECDTLLHEWMRPLGFTPAQIAEALHMRVGGLMASDTHLCTRTGHHLEVARRTAPYGSVALLGEAGRLPLPDGRWLRYRFMPREALPAIPRQSTQAALDADALDGQPVLRSLEESDRFRPFGMKGQKLVSDYLTDRHFSRIAKLRQLAVADAQGIAWLVDQRPAQRTAVTPATRRVLLLQTVEEVEEKHVDVPSGK